MEKFDKVIYGVIAGLVLPVFGYFISFLVKTRDTILTFNDYWNYTLRGEDQMDILIFCLIPNMFFFYFTNFRWNTYEMTKGLVGVTLIMAIALFIITM